MIPGTLYGIAVPASAHAICTQPLQAAELVGRQWRVGGAVVDGAVRDRLDAAARADRAVLEGVVVGAPRVPASRPRRAAGQNELPAPVIVVGGVLHPSAPRATASSAITVIARRASPFLVMCSLLVLGFPCVTSFRGRAARGLQACDDPVTVW